MRRVQQKLHLLWKWAQGYLPVTCFLISIGQQQSPADPPLSRVALKLHNRAKERPSACGESSGAHRQHITTSPRRHLRWQTTQEGRLCYEEPTRPGHHLFALLPSGRKHGLIKTGANRQINSVYPLKQPGSWPFLSCLISPGLRHNNPTPSERKKKKSNNCLLQNAPKIYMSVLYCMCACTVTYSYMALCALAPQRSTTSFSMCVCVLVYFCAFSTSKAKGCQSCAILCCCFLIRWQ